MAPTCRAHATISAARSGARTAPVGLPASSARRARRRRSTRARRSGRARSRRGSRRPRRWDRRCGGWRSGSPAPGRGVAGGTRPVPSNRWSAGRRRARPRRPAGAASSRRRRPADRHVRRSSGYPGAFAAARRASWTTCGRRIDGGSDRQVDAAVRVLRRAVGVGGEDVPGEVREQVGDALPSGQDGHYEWSCSCGGTPASSGASKSWAPSLAAPPGDPRSAKNSAFAAV